MKCFVVVELLGRGLFDKEDFLVAGMVVQVVLAGKIGLEQVEAPELLMVVDIVYLDLGLLVGVGIDHLPLDYPAVVDIVHSLQD